MSSSDSVKLYKIRKLISELSNKTGRGTELISLYIPPKKAIHEVIANLREEWGTAGNIKSDTTRNHVQDALVKTMQRLKLYKETPENGLVIFCGALPTDGAGSEIIRIYEIIPPKPISTYLYRCDDHFHLEYLKEMLKEEKVYGLLSIDATEAALGTLSGNRLEVVDIITSGVSGKTRKGGQSARRYERLRDMELTYYFNRVGEHATRVFLNGTNISGLIIGGPGPTKDEFIKGGYLHYQLQKSILAVIDTSYAGREGVRELVERASEVLRGVRLIEEKKLVQRFLSEINKTGGLAIYGLPRVIDALQKANVEIVLVSDDVDMTKVSMKCKNCGAVKEEILNNQDKIQRTQKMLSEPCKICGSIEYDVNEIDIVDMLEEMALQIGARVEVVTSGTEEGSMLKSFGGIAAILRYKVQ